MRARLAHRPTVALFTLCIGVYAYFYQAGGWNQNVRFDLVRSLVEQRTAVIDDYYRNTGDLSCRGPAGRCTRPRPARGEHAYCDKAPGASWLAVPAYAAAHAVAGSARPSPRFLAISSYVATVWAVAVPAALAVVMLYVLLAVFGLSARARAFFALAYGLGTLAFPYATLFYGHQLMAALVLLGFGLLVQTRHGSASASASASASGLAAAGLLLGLAVAVEYPAALAVAPICVYAASFVRPWPRLGWLIAGLAAPGLALAAYHWLVFGGPATLPYEFSTQPHRGQGYFMGLGLPRGEALINILFSGYRGLFYSAPWLLLAVPGAAVLARRPRFRAEVAVCMAVSLLFIWLNASLVDWQGGWAMGARYLIPAIPFLVIAAAGVALIPMPRPWLRAGAWLLAAAGVLYAAFLMLVGTAVKPEVDVRIARPFADFLLPRFYGGDLAVSTQSIDSIGSSRAGERFAWNLGQLMGLDGLAALLPLGLFVLGTGAWLLLAVRRADARDSAAA